MCGRVTLTWEMEEAAERFQVKETVDWTPRYNIAPTQPVPVIVNDGQNHLELFRWGLVPFWAKDITIGNKMINARAETIDTKPSFRHCLPKQRCLILADGFFEWKKEGKKKRPYRFTLQNHEVFGFAGIWDAWKNPKGEVFHTCAIITTGPNELVLPLHDRMPVILEREKEGIWLDPSLTDSLLLKSLLTPYPAGLMDAYEVSSCVNTVGHDSIECIQPVTLPNTLF